MTTVEATWENASETSAVERRYKIVRAVQPRYHRRDFARAIQMSLLAETRTSINPQTKEEIDTTSTNPPKVIRLRFEQSTGQAVMEIRRRTGFTWELLSELFNVSRRTIHHWANGRQPSSKRERGIRKTLEAVRHLDEGSQRSTHDRLLSTIDGTSPFDLLVDHRYSDVMQLAAGSASVTNPRIRTPLSEDERARRRPTRPELLLDAIQESPKLPAMNARVIRPARKSK